MRRLMKNGALRLPLVARVTKGPAAGNNTGSYAERGLDTSVANVWGTSVLLTVSCTMISSTAARNDCLRVTCPFFLVQKRRV